MVVLQTADQSLVLCALILISPERLKSPAGLFPSLIIFIGIVVIIIIIILKYLIFVIFLLVTTAAIIIIFIVVFIVVIIILQH